MLQKNTATFQQFETASQYEWLETNGLGGYAGSSITGANTRRYHGLLVAATVPPAERMALVSKLDETIVINDHRTELATNLYRENVVAPSGYRHINRFTKELFPQWLYKAEGVELQKTITMVQGENTTLVRYEVLKAPGTFSLELQPFLSVRDYHSMAHANNAIHWDVDFDNDTFHNQPYEGTPAVFIKVPGSAYHHHPDWYLNFNYAEEINRGLDCEEDLFTHGHFSVALKEGDVIAIIISTENPAGKDGLALFEKERIRKQLLLKDSSGHETFQYLLLAADQLIVKRGEDLKTIIAGYHWFADWGRDTMIALPGLCLSIGRYDDAKKILSAFANSVNMGMLPNRFRDNGEEPEYNNVDGTLWYFIAVYKYLLATGNQNFVLNDILPVLKDIIEWHFKGTRYHIHVAEDGLLYSGEEGVQLTWMDAKVGDLVITPRTGKAVEIQALWYNALCIFSELLALNGEKDNAAATAALSEKVKETFNKAFWFEEGKYLYDVIDGQDQPDTSLRPNQLFAISLPFALIDDKVKAAAIVDAVTQQLYTPVGLRSLSPSHPAYVGIYEGNAFKRDCCYHQGTLWSWLLGPYIDALIKTRGSAQEAEAIINNLEYHLQDACIGSISEIFDGDAPHHPRGCVAQAWSVGEILRVIKEHSLFAQPANAPLKETVKEMVY